MGGTNECGLSFGRGMIEREFLSGEEEPGPARRGSSGWMNGLT